MVAWGNPRSVETAIARLSDEIRQIDGFFYGGSEDDRVLYAGMLERKRDDMVRSAVLQLHTAIEDVLIGHITCHVLNVRHDRQGASARSQAAKALRKMLFGAESIGFAMKLNLAVATGILQARRAKQLEELNTLRNKCGHNWLLKAVVRRGRRRGQKKPPLLTFRGRDLHRVEVLEDFCAEFGALYAKLWLKFVSFEPK